MDPRNPRWDVEAAEARRRSVRMWKIIVAVVTAVTAGTVVVASCHDMRERARREVAEPAYVETTGASGSGRERESASAGARESAGAGAGDQGGAPKVVRPVVTAPPAITVVPPATGAARAGDADAPASRGVEAGIVGVPGSVVTAPRVTAPPAYPGAGAEAEAGASGRLPSPSPSTFTSTSTSTDGAAAETSGTRGDASAGGEGGVADAGARVAPEPTVGAGKFITEAPYWGASAFPTNPEAGAGPFKE